MINQYNAMKMDSMILRVGAILAHAMLNIVLISYITNFDISSSWLAVIGFVSVLFILMVMFIKHLVSFINYIKTKTK